MRLTFALALALAGCDHAAPPVVSIAPLPTSSAVAPQVVEIRASKIADESDFTSDRVGMVHLVAESDGSLAGTYPNNGILTCRADLACRWYDSSTEGRATFHRKSDGTLEGTWGNDASDTDGGAWTLVPVKRAGVLDGVWDTNWGAAKIETTRAGVHVEYTDGQMDCTEHERKLTCNWTQGSMTGVAELAIESTRVLRGRWGNGASSTDGGAWVFVRR